MKTITIKEYGSLSINDPRNNEVGELFIMRNHSSDEIEPHEGKVVSLFEVINLTETGYESKMVHYKVLLKHII